MEKRPIHHCECSECQHAGSNPTKVLRQQMNFLVLWEFPWSERRSPQLAGASWRFTRTSSGVRNAFRAKFQRANFFLSTLDKHQRRLYVGLESAKLGRGGDRQLADITGMSVDTITLIRGLDYEPSRANSGPVMKHNV